MAARDEINLRLIVVDDNEFAPGDVVRLKSGGPKMTFLRHDEDGRAKVVWYDGSNSYEPYLTAVFAPHALKAVQ